MAKILNFFKEAKLELSKVTWPSRSQIIKYTFVVIGISLSMALFLGILDAIFAYILREFIIS